MTDLRGEKEDNVDDEERDDEEEEADLQGEEDEVNKEEEEEEEDTAAANERRCTRELRDNIDFTEPVAPVRCNTENMVVFTMESSARFCTHQQAAREEYVGSAHMLLTCNPGSGWNVSLRLALSTGARRCTKRSGGRLRSSPAVLVMLCPYGQWQPHHHSSSRRILL